MKSRKKFFLRSRKKTNKNNCRKVEKNGTDKPEVIEPKKNKPEVIKPEKKNLRSATDIARDDDCCTIEKLHRMSNMLKLLLHKHRQNKKKKYEKFYSELNDGYGMFVNNYPPYSPHLYPPYQNFSPLGLLPYNPLFFPPNSPFHNQPFNHLHSVPQQPLPNTVSRPNVTPSTVAHQPNVAPKVVGSHIPSQKSPQQGASVEINQKKFAMKPLQQNVSVASGVKPSHEAGRRLVAAKNVTTTEQVKKVDFNDNLAVKKDLKTANVVKTNEKPNESGLPLDQVKTEIKATSSFETCQPEISFVCCRKEKKEKCSRRKKCDFERDNSCDHLIYKKHCKKTNKSNQKKKTKNCSIKNYRLAHISPQKKPRQGSIVEINHKQLLIEPLQRNPSAANNVKPSNVAGGKLNAAKTKTTNEQVKKVDTIDNLAIKSDLKTDTVVNKKLKENPLPLDQIEIGIDGTGSLENCPPEISIVCCTKEEKGKRSKRKKSDFDDDDSDDHMAHKKHCKKKNKCKSKKKNKCCKPKNNCANNVLNKQCSKQNCLISAKNWKNIETNFVTNKKRSSQKFEWKSFKKWFQKHRKA